MRETKLTALCLNLSTVGLCTLLAVEVIKHRQVPTGYHDQKTVVGRSLSAARPDLANGKKTIVLALKAGCPYCNESARFYRNLALAVSKRSDLQIVVAMPDDPSRAAAYLRQVSIPIKTVYSLPLAQLGVAQVPTVLLADAKGVVRHSWTGLLDEVAEQTAEGELLR